MNDGMYGARAEYYDPIYHWKDYRAESDLLHALLAREGIADGARLLEAGCGTGSHLQHLTRWYKAAGFDLHRGMLDVARKKLPGVTLFEADMTSFQADEPADALVCLFAAFAYLHPIDRAVAAARCFFRALRPGGIAVVEPFVIPEKFLSGRLHMQTYDGPDLKLCRMSYPTVRDDLAVIVFHWLVLARDGVADRFSETHELWLASDAALIRVFEEAGFEARFEPNGLMKDRGLLLARRP